MRRHGRADDGVTPAPKPWSIQRGRDGVDLSWQMRARCAGIYIRSETYDPFYSTDRGGNRSPVNPYLVALAFCKECPVRQQCLDHALNERESYGVWGGTTPDERATMLRRRRK